MELILIPRSDTHLPSSPKSLDCMSTFLLKVGKEKEWKEDTKKLNILFISTTAEMVKCSPIFLMFPKVKGDVEIYPDFAIFLALSGPVNMPSRFFSKAQNQTPDTG